MPLTKYPVTEPDASTTLIPSPPLDKNLRQGPLCTLFFRHGSL
jgi:hypothetical protein